jgi:hypothetical protein
LRDELESLRLVHSKTLDELRQATRRLGEAQTELHGRISARSDHGRISARSDEHQEEAFKEELDGVQSKLSEVLAERDRQKADLKRIREQSSAKDARLWGLQEELRASKEQLSANDALVQKLHEELRIAKACNDSPSKNLQNALGFDNAGLEKAVGDYSNFINRIINSSARPVLNDYLDLQEAELLGVGHYGYVMTCRAKASNDKVVLKLQGVQWVDAAVREWAHTEEVGRHKHIVEMMDLFMHGDSDRMIEDHITKLPRPAGQCPKWFPNAYICMVSEYMDRGSVSSLMEKQLLTLEGVCAVTRQVASALVFMHQKQRNHNNIKPDNILLKSDFRDDILHVKLSDAGAIEHSVDHSRDRELFAYAIWCMVVGRDASRCPSKQDRMAAMGEFMKSPLLGRRATARGTALIETVVGLWDEQLDIPLVACNAEYEGCEVREPESEEMKRQLAACADFEVTKRASDALERFQRPGHRAPSLNVDMDNVMGGFEEGSIPVVDSRDP